MVNKSPWQKLPLSKWAICGMNHYHIDGEKFIFVSMVKDGKCITQEGVDNWVIWNNLSILADLAEAKTKPPCDNCDYKPLIVDNI